MIFFFNSSITGVQLALLFSSHFLVKDSYHDIMVMSCELPLLEFHRFNSNNYQLSNDETIIDESPPLPLDN